MRAQHFLDLERRDLVAASLDDIDAAAAEDAVAPVLEDGDIAGAEPSVAERFCGRFGPSPVFVEYRRAADFDLARDVIRHCLASLVHAPHFDTRQWDADMTGNARATVGIRQGHADLGHPVTLEQDVGGDRLPLLELRNRKCRGPRDHQTQLRAARSHRLSFPVLRALPLVDQTTVDRRHSHEEGELPALQPIPDDAGIEPRKAIASRS